MTVPLTAERKQAAIARAAARVRDCDRKRHEAYEAAIRYPASNTLERRLQSAADDLEAAEDKLARITKEYGESTCNS